MERDRLFAILEQLVLWESSNDHTLLQAAHAEIMRSTNGHPPAIYDPFCGGGSIPVEGQRLGLSAYGTDLNPVAVLVTKAMIETPPAFANRPPINPGSRNRKGMVEWTAAQGLADDVRYYGKWICDRAFGRLSALYPKAKLPKEYGGSEATVIAWLWARTVKCPNPACGATMPLARSFSISTKKGSESYVVPEMTATGRLTFRVEKAGSAPAGSVGRRGAHCISCKQPVELEYIRREGRANRLSAELMAIVADAGGRRVCLTPDEGHAAVAQSASADWSPETDLPEKALSFRVQAYGMTRHRDLFTSRQLAFLSTLTDLVAAAKERAMSDGADDEYANALATYLAICVSKTAVFHNTLARWRAGENKSAPAFGRQALPMVWDFAEVNPFAGAGGDFLGVIEGCCKVLSNCPVHPQGKAFQHDATKHENTVPTALVCTDPPYYDNIGYADLSDFFYVWLRRCLRAIQPDLFSTVLTPKSTELIATPYRFDGNAEEAKSFFEDGFSKAFRRIREIQHPDFPLTVFYAFKQAETEDDEEDGESIASTGWETMLDGLLKAQFQITGTWPGRTEGGSRMNARGTNSLASSIVLVCRPRSVDAPMTTEMDLQQALRSEMPRALRAMQKESIAPVDLAQSAIGPGMAIYSRYSKVVGPDGKAVSVRRALEMINRVLDEVLSEQEGEFDQDTRFALAWFQQFGMRSGTFGTADVLSRAMNIGVTGMENAGILEAKAGTVRLLKWEELPEDWDPEKDRRLTVWEMTHHLIRLMYKESDAAAAHLLTKLGGDAEKARDLAYRLYQICERSKWSQEAQPYNALVVAWPNLTAEARQLEKRTSPEQLTL